LFPVTVTRQCSSCRYAVCHVTNQL
jgi:hypothetical protein